MKGIVLAGGAGTRLYPVTLSISKQILPIYNKPMIYYPISCLLIAGIKDILIISTPRDLPLIQNLLGDGSDFGISFSYAEQPQPNGIAQAFIIGENFIGNNNVALVLGDNIFYGHELSTILKNNVSNFNTGGVVFTYKVNNPSRYGVIKFAEDNKTPVDIIEKPKNPPSNYAVTGLYLYDNEVVSIAKSLKPSARGELEITDLNKVYLQREKLAVEKLGRGFAWLDTGTFDSLLQASEFIATIENRQGLMVSCLEEIAFYKGYITKEQLLKRANYFTNSQYGEYLKKIIEDKTPGAI